MTMAALPDMKNIELTLSNKPTTLLRVQGLSKAFGGLQVLNDINLELHQGEVVLLRGEMARAKQHY